MGTPGPSASDLRMICEHVVLLQNGKIFPERTGSCGRRPAGRQISFANFRLTRFGRSRAAAFGQPIRHRSLPLGRSTTNPAGSSVCRSGGLGSPGLLDHVGVDRIRVGGCKHVVEPPHAPWRVAAFEHDVAEQAVCDWCLPPKIRQDAVAEHVATRAVPIIETFARGNLRSGGRPSRQLRTPLVFRELRVDMATIGEKRQSPSGGRARLSGSS